MTSKIQFLLLGLLVTLTFSGCNNDRTKLLSRTWKVDNIILADDTPDNIKNDFALQLPLIKMMMRLTYYEDGSFENDNMGSINKGKWKFNFLKNQIVVDIGAEKPINYKIITLTDSLCEYETMDEKKPIKFVLVPGGKIDYNSTMQEIQKYSMEHGLYDMNESTEPETEYAQEEAPGTETETKE